MLLFLTGLYLLVSSGETSNRPNDPSIPEYISAIMGSDLTLPCYVIYDDKHKLRDRKNSKRNKIFYLDPYLNSEKNGEREHRGIVIEINSTKSDNASQSISKKIFNAKNSNRFSRILKNGDDYFTNFTWIFHSNQVLVDHKCSMVYKRSIKSTEINHPTVVSTNGQSCHLKIINVTRDVAGVYQSATCGKFIVSFIEKQPKCGANLITNITVKNRIISFIEKLFNIKPNRSHLGKYNFSKHNIIDEKYKYYEEMANSKNSDNNNDNVKLKNNYLKILKKSKSENKKKAELLQQYYNDIKGEYLLYSVTCTISYIITENDDDKDDDVLKPIIYFDPALIVEERSVSQTVNVEEATGFAIVSNKMDDETIENSKSRSGVHICRAIMVTRDLRSTKLKETCLVDLKKLKAKKKVKDSTIEGLQHIPEPCTNIPNLILTSIVGSFVMVVFGGSFTYFTSLCLCCRKQRKQRQMEQSQKPESRPSNAVRLSIITYRLSLSSDAASDIQDLEELQATKLTPMSNQNDDKPNVTQSHPHTFHSFKTESHGYATSGTAAEQEERRNARQKSHQRKDIDEYHNRMRWIKKKMDKIPVLKSSSRTKSTKKSWISHSEESQEYKSVSSIPVEKRVEYKKQLMHDIAQKQPKAEKSNTASKVSATHDLAKKQPTAQKSKTASKVSIYKKQSPIIQSPSIVRDHVFEVVEHEFQVTKPPENTLGRDKYHQSFQENAIRYQQVSQQLQQLRASPSKRTTLHSYKTANDSDKKVNEKNLMEKLSEKNVSRRLTSDILHFPPDTEGISGGLSKFYDKDKF